MSSKILNTLVRHIRCYHFKLNFSHRHTNVIHSKYIGQNNKICTPLYFLSLSTNSKRDPKVVRYSRKFDDLFEDLNSYYLYNGYVKPDMFLKVSESLNSVVLSPEQSNFILESVNYLYHLSSDERMKNFKNLWNHFKKNYGINHEKVLIALKIFQQNKITLEEASSFLNDFNDFDQHLSTYEELVRLTCENGDIEQAAKILEEMRVKKFPLTNKVFSALILGHSRNMNIKNVEAVLDTMNAANLEPSTESFSELVRAYMENNMEENAEILLNKISDLSVNQIAMLLKSASSLKFKNTTDKLIQKLPEEIIKNPFSGILRGVCIDLLYSKGIDAAFFFVNSFPQSPILKENEDTDKFAKFFINEIISNDKFPNEQCFEILQKLVENGKNKRAIHVACEVSLRNYPQKSEFYLEALSDIEKLRPHYFWPLFNYNFGKNGEMGIFDTLKLMSKLSVQPDYETLHYHCIPRLSIILQNVEETAKQFEKSGLKPSTFLTSLISHLIIQQKQSDIIKINNLYPTKIDTLQLVKPLIQLATNTKNNKLYVQLLKVLTEKSENKQFDLTGQILIELTSNPKFNKDISTVFKILNELKIQEIKISKTVGELLQSQFNKLDQNSNVHQAMANLKIITDNDLNLSFTETGDYQIIHPRDMNLEELECHLFELEAKKLNTREVLRRLLQLYVRENKLEEALKIKKKMDELSILLSPGMLASILDLHIKLKNLADSETTLQDIQKKYPGFLIDEHKVIDLTALMVEKDKFEEGRKMLMERATIAKTKGGENIYRNLWNLLTQVAQYSVRMNPNDTNNLAKEFFLMLKKYKFCNADNVLLGPIIREHLLKNHIKDAVYEYKFIAEHYRKTPLQLELMIVLIRISNNIEKNSNLSEEEAKLFLQDIVTLTSQIHGAVNCNGTLLLAVAESGSENQLRKLLINPDFRLNVNALSKNIEYLNSNGRIDTILKLAKACRGIRQVLNEYELYKMLLNEFARKNNYESAIELFNKLEADDEFKISTEFVKIIVNLLKLNKIDIPNNIALKYQSNK